MTRAGRGPGRLRGRLQPPDGRGRVGRDRLANRVIASRGAWVLPSPIFFHGAKMYRFTSLNRLSREWAAVSKHEARKYPQLGLRGRPPRLCLPMRVDFNLCRIG